MDAREAILARTRDAISRSQRGPAPAVPRDYIRVGSDAPGSKPVVDDMVEKLVDYDAVVKEAETDESIADAIDELLGDSRTVVVPDGLPQQWVDAARRGGREIRVDSLKAPLSHEELDHTDAVLTCSRLGISISGTIVLDGESDQGRRAITLVPDHHVCIVERESIVPTVPQAVDVMGHNPLRPLTWIAGPSATADIELIRVQGVHGPRHLGVVIAH
ncbi:LutC/YkgG family protein [Actinomyces vulturis]|uniref:LutC/YkgG family protein n=1 Tax=Actinomyces vulturis TaxID=1857645 RepID=UPI000832902E|nr:LUD domain-containing protein [Actinomyces vulturis]